MLVSRTHYYILHPFKPHRLCDLLVLSPAKISKSHAKPLFITYQLLQAMRGCHAVGLSIAQLKTSDIFIDEKLWLQVGLNGLGERAVSSGRGSRNERSNQTLFSCVTCNTDEIVSNNTRDVSSSNANDKCSRTQRFYWSTVKRHSKRPLAELTLDWMRGDVTNLEYLLLLNFLAGRRLNDADHHPIMPWVSDLTSPDGNLRDLTKSKFRLTKGDEQLDMTYGDGTYDATLVRQTGQIRGVIPHHVSDVLSNITYYVYKARCTPQSVLTAHVRPLWEPLQYPGNIERVQEWSPEECIPEFFLDPDVFHTLHPDLADLAVPQWASSVDDFLSRHRAVLESEPVSNDLHHWIDLNFGYKVRLCIALVHCGTSCMA